jgi:hypothetical protein
VQPRAACSPGTRTAQTCCSCTIRSGTSRLVRGKQTQASLRETRNACGGDSDSWRETWQGALAKTSNCTAPMQARLRVREPGTEQLGLLLLMPSLPAVSLETLPILVPRYLLAAFLDYRTHSTPSIIHSELSLWTQPIIPSTDPSQQGDYPSGRGLMRTLSTRRPSMSTTSNR